MRRPFLRTMVSACAAATAPAANTMQARTPIEFPERRILSILTTSGRPFGSRYQDMPKVPRGWEDGEYEKCRISLAAEKQRVRQNSAHPKIQLSFVTLWLVGADQCAPDSDTSSHASRDNEYPDHFVPACLGNLRAGWIRRLDDHAVRASFRNGLNFVLGRNLKHALPAGQEKFVCADLGHLGNRHL